MNNLTFGYNQTKYGKSYAQSEGLGWRALLNFGNGIYKTVDLPSDVGQNEYVINQIRDEALAHERRTGHMPTIEYVFYNRTIERLEQAAELGTRVFAQIAVGGSVVAGFLDRYRMTLAARIDGLRNAISVIRDISEPCIDQLPKALENVKNAEAYVSKIKAAQNSLPLAVQALQDAKTLKTGVETCANLANEFTKIVAPMEEVNSAMAGGSLTTKLHHFIANLDMSVAKEAWSAYSLGEQSLHFLWHMAGGVTAGLATRSATHEIAANLLHISPRRAKLVSNLVGIGTCAALVIRGDGLIRAASVAACATATGYLAKGVATGFQTVRGFFGG